MEKKAEAVVKVVMIMVLLICFTFACGGKYDDVIDANNEFIEIMDDYSKSLEKADNAKDVAAAIDKVAEKMEKLGPKMKKLREKYPDLTNEKDLPEQLVKSQKKMEQVSGRLAASFMKLVKYVGNPDVMEAQKRLGIAMQSMNQQE